MMDMTQMRWALVVIMACNAALFFFGALQHAGVAFGPFHEPPITPAAIVETICGLSLLSGAVVICGHSASKWRVALITNIVALAGVLLGIGALALGAGPRTESNDTYHRIMLALIGTAFVILLLRESVARRKEDSGPQAGARS